MILKNKEFVEQFDWLDRLNSDDELFESEFKKIMNIYPIKNCEDVHNFLKEKRGLIIVLNEIRPLLMEYVPYAFVRIELDMDPIFVPQLLLFVAAPEMEFYNGFKEDIRKINSIMEPLLINLGLDIEFFIFRDVYNSSFKFSKVQ